MTNSGSQRPLSRRVFAAVIDLALVAIPTMLAIAVLHERFPFVRGLEGVQFSNQHQERINQIDQGFSRAIEVGDSLYTLSGSGWWVSLGLLIATTLAVYVAVPARAGLRTPGQLLMKLASTVADEPELVATLDLTDAPSEPEVTDAEAHADAQDGAAETSLDELDDVLHVTPGDAIEVPAGGAIDVDVDVTAGEPSGDTAGDAFGPITLADEADYLRWDRTNTTDTDLRDQPESALPAPFSQLALPESSMSDAPLTAATLVKTRESDSEAKAGGRRLSDSETPVWNENWQAWLYWDRERERWLRHDTDAGRWKPLS